MSDTILDALARDVAARGAHPFILHEGRAVSYAELDRLANAAARALAALGVVRGDRVTLALGNCVEYLVAAFGILKVGGVLNPVNPVLGAAELGYIVRHADETLLASGNLSRKCECSTRNRRIEELFRKVLMVLLRRLFVSWKDLRRPNCYPCRRFVVQSR